MAHPRRDRLPATQLGRLIESGPDDVPAGSLWNRLDMERVSRRLIEVARLATAEHAAARLRRAIRRRDQMLESRLNGDEPPTAA